MSPGSHPKVQKDMTVFDAGTHRSPSFTAVGNSSAVTRSSDAYLEHES